MTTEQLLKEIQDCEDKSTCDLLCRKLADLLEKEQWHPHWISYPVGTNKYKQWRNTKYYEMP